MKKIMIGALLILSTINIPVYAYTTGWGKYGEVCDENPYYNPYWYYIQQDGNFAKGWKKIDGNWYYFYNNGVMAHDTFIGGYYLKSNGVWTNNI